MQEKKKKKKKKKMWIDGLCWGRIDDWGIPARS